MLVNDDKQNDAVLRNGGSNPHESENKWNKVDEKQERKNSRFRT
jgi:hypothetical protein